MNRIEATFAYLAGKRTALVPYLPLGFPTRRTSAELIRAAAPYADLIELGVPFSDPLADGPVIAQAAQKSLANGMNLASCLDLARQARAEGISVPFLFMGYYNPFLQFGLGRLAGCAADAGVDGLIVPDLPLEEATPLNAACRANGLELVLLAAPTSTDDRLRSLGRATSGFLYLVSVTGVTGTRATLPDNLGAFIGRARACTNKPLGVGFGIGDGASARRVAQVADGVIVGSALVRRIAEEATAVRSAQLFLEELFTAMYPDRNPPR